MPSALATFVDGLPSDQHVSVRAEDAEGRLLIDVDADRQHYAASTMKSWLVLAAWRLADAGRLDLDEPVTVHDSFASAHDGSLFTMEQSYDNDDEVWRRLGTPVSLRWLALRAIVRSSNLATNLVLDHVGVDAIAEAMQHVCTRHSKVERGIEDAVAREAGLDNRVAATDLAATYQALLSGTAASHHACSELLAMHGAQQIRDGFPTAFPPSFRLAHKSGWVDGSTHDAGVVTAPGRPPVVLAVCTSTPDDVDGHALVVETTRAAWEDLT